MPTHMRSDGPVHIWKKVTPRSKYALCGEVEPRYTGLLSAGPYPTCIECLTLGDHN